MIQATEAITVATTNSFQPSTETLMRGRVMLLLIVAVSSEAVDESLVVSIVQTFKQRSIIALRRWPGSSQLRLADCK
ncbi:hypothetical protein [Lichenicoccus sp.]|uniref:hypothetical protein n=1 Tax=Lichenicoccus sp. TaxID=2781899 RepID=UPI003D1070C0